MMIRGGDGDALGGRVSVMQLQLNPSVAGEMAAMIGGTAVEVGGGGGQRSKDEKVLQWGQKETRELIAIRADLERDFTVARRNKTLWEAVSSRMREKGYPRSPDQCKCKWKNLVNRYKVGPLVLMPRWQGRWIPVYVAGQGPFGAAWC
ncbi:Trihelix transcription factor GT-3b [Platanthera guangdongensis]|uniref:Trihelix transcription factor GT-3b n=1 Tax=Platanthera guangdongensis TaxID=2320717 RepID=A0ABR2LRC8_9ASPA